MAYQYQCSIRSIIIESNGLFLLELYFDNLQYELNSILQKKHEYELPQKAKVILKGLSH
jgi:hypothetical protein